MESLKPQDVMVVLKLCADAIRPNHHPTDESRRTMAALAIELGLSSSEVHAAIRRSRASGLLLEDPATHVKSKSELRRGKPRYRPNYSAILEFLIHGLKYVFPATRGEPTRGVPTSYAAPPLSNLIVKGRRELIPVWPSAKGTERGVSFEPLYRTAPAAAQRDSTLYELLAIADALRDGRARERKIAEEQLRKRLENPHAG